MVTARLVRQRWLDPREAAEVTRCPIADAVNIPFSELPDRVHELPPRAQDVGVVGPAPLVREVITWLTANGRRGFAVETYTAQAEPDSSDIGRLWEPNGLLRDVLPRLSPATVLDLACGTGRDAVFMSSCGWDVTAVDVLPDALELAQATAARYAPALRRIRWLKVDLESEAPQFEHAFDLITAFRYLHRPLFARLREWLRPGGSVLCETFTTVHHRRYGKPSRPAHVLQPGELPRLLPGFEIRHHSEAWRGWAHTARVWAVLPSGARA